MVWYLNFSNPAGDSSYTKNFDNIFSFPNSWKEIIVCFYSTHENIMYKNMKWTVFYTFTGLC